MNFKDWVYAIHGSDSTRVIIAFFGSISHILNNLASRYDISLNFMPTLLLRIPTILLIYVAFKNGVFVYNNGV